MSEREVVRFEVEDGIGVITVDNPPVNALGAGVSEGIVASVDKAEADAAVRALVLIGAGRSFIAGADIRRFGKPREVPARRSYDALEGSSKPVVPPSTATRWAAASRTRSAAIGGSPYREPRSACPKCSSASSQAAAARSACHGSSVPKRPWR